MLSILLQMSFLINANFRGLSHMWSILTILEWWRSSSPLVMLREKKKKSGSGLVSTDSMDEGICQRWSLSFWSIIKSLHIDSGIDHRKTVLPFSQVVSPPFKILVYQLNICNFILHISNIIAFSVLILHYLTSLFHNS